MTAKPLSPTAPRALSPARIDPLPPTVIARDAERRGAPIVITNDGVEHVRRLAAIGASDTMIAGALGVDRATFRAVRRRQGEVDEALAAGRATLHLELGNHLLAAARGGEWQAAATLWRLRQEHRPLEEDLPPADEDAEQIDWSRVPFDERRALLAALERIDQLRRGDYAAAEVPPDDRAMLNAIRLTTHERAQRIAALRDRLESGAPNAEQSHTASLRRRIALRQRGINPDSPEAANVVIDDGQPSNTSSDDSHETE